MLFIGKEFDVLSAPFVVIHAGKTAWAGRNWLSDRFDELANRFNISREYGVVCVGNDGDHLVPCDLDLRGKTSIQQLAGVISQARAFVGIDSLPMHIAQAVNVPGICFFGCIKPHTRIIRQNMIGITAKNLECLGCHQRELSPKTAFTECPNGTLDCEKLVSVDDMWEKIQEVLCCQNV
jgi:ADP-heptose:LPS heptosyltransferase